MAKRVMPLSFPTLGIVRRYSYQRGGGQYSTPDCLNVWPDDPFLSRERGGSRPGLGKALATQLGSGAPIRSLADVSYISSGALTTRLLAISNGSLYYESTLGTTFTAVGGNLTLNSAVNLSIADRSQIAYIADYGGVVASGTDGVMASLNQFTSASVGNFTTAGANAYDYSLVITAGGAGNEIQTITITGVPTGGSFTLAFTIGNSRYLTQAIPYNASAANVVTCINNAYGSTLVTGGGGALPGTPVTITFSGTDSTGLDIAMMDANGDALTGGTLTFVAVTETTKGGPVTPGTYKITASGATLTTSPDANKNGTGITFYVTRSPKKYDPLANTLTQWTATSGKGSVPANCSALCLWRDRMVLAGGVKSPFLWYMSRQGDPLDWDYSVVNDAGAAIAGTLASAGQLGENIRALIPHSDDCLIFGCDTSLWIMRGDPGYGGQIDRLSSEIGIVGKDAWCYTPEGYLYFMSQDGLYIMAPGCGSTPQSVSRERLPQELLAIASTTTVCLKYDSQHRVIHIGLTPSAAGTPTHYTLDPKTTTNRDSGASAAFFPITVNSNYDPFSMISRRNSISSYSVTYWGCRDGYVRRFQSDLAQDDGTNFSSYVLIGPFKTCGNDMEDGMLHELQCTLAASSGAVDWTAYAGKSGEQAYNGTVKQGGTFSTAGMNPSARPRVRGGMAMVKLANHSANSRWALESLSCVVEPLGRRRI